MILHRLRLTNFRGVADREIVFPDQGVVVVCGPNEVGKSSMLEALDLLLTYRDRSGHRDVKAVKPANADVGSEVEAEISTGPYRFVYRKRFHKKAGTELDIIAPKREHVSGDEAHDRVEAMLAETLDTKLWDAQRVLQSAATDAVNLSGSDSLARALDAAAGETDTAPSGDDSLLIDLIDAEYLKYFTGTGRPTGAWKAIAERVKTAEADANRCLLAVEEVNDRVSRHETLTETVQTIDESLAPAGARLTAARITHDALTELRDQLRQARQVAATLTAASTNSALADTQRRQLVTDCQRRAETLVALQNQLAVAEQEEAAAQQVAQAAGTAAEQAGTALDGARQRFDAARAAAQACVARDEADRLAARVTSIDQVERELAEVAGQLSVITLTAAMLAGIEQHWAAVQRIEAQLQADATTVAFTAPTDLDITVDGQPRTLAAGESWTQPASAAVVVEVPGVLAVRIDPGASAVKLHADLAAAQQLLDRALDEAGVADVEAARALDARRRALTESSTTHIAKLEGLCANEDAAVLRERLAELRAAASDGDQLDAETVAAELAAADDALRAARTVAEAKQKASAEATAAHAGKSTQATVLRTQHAAAEAESATVHEQLATVRAALSDEAVAAQAAADAEEQRKADAVVAALAERYGAADPAAVDAELAAAAQAVDALTAQREAAKLELHTVTAELGVIGNEGRQSQLDDAQAELKRARAEHARIQDRAQAAALLRNTMIRHRDNTRQRYVQPYRAELERLGRTVFGPTFEVDVDTELTIRTRTLNGCTVPYESLSGGAKEQLGILARLAGAALVAKEDTVPVIIDDALGFTDPERLTKMGTVFDTVGSHGQVIVLTCSPTRYLGVEDAHVIELSA
ncbi:AAA family ATPase [Mycobacterium sp. M26]|uniref:AAA family ATPase n=1 Tax=Mycobacterium sp. M26 TaxID=1762962 RepID=UPI00073E8B7C|nr:AAA family ATPase [Mycobacterium sp. M26]